jgi:putative nucleotidyltransferase with HDIG domain
MAIPMILLRISQMQYVDRTREVVTELREKNQILKKNSEEISELNEGLLVTLSEVIDLRDPYVLGHSKQVSKYATQIAELLGLKEKQIELIRKAGLLHDIGKLGIAMEILTKPGKLTRDEYEIIKNHAALGGELIKNSPSLRQLAPIIRHHHEYFNGQGYPDKIAGNQISIEARILAVADAVEAMTSDRPYRKALKPDQVIAELNKNSGTQFDPLVVEQAIAMIETIWELESTPVAQRDGTLMTGSKLTFNLQNQ